MNDINVIRRALEGHSAALGGTLDDVNRHRQLHDRIDRSTRRRNGLRGLAALTVAAVAAAIVIPQLGGKEPGPAEGMILGLQAPSALDAPDHSYRFVEGFEGPSSRVLRVKVKGLGTRRILTWATATDDQDVQVRVPNGTVWEDTSGDQVVWDSTRADFTDWVEIPPFAEGTIEISSNTGAVGLGAALYEVDPSALPDRVDGFGGDYFRASGPTSERLNTAVGEAGQVDLRIPFDGTHRTIAMAYSCQGLPDGAVIRAEVAGSQTMAEAADACSDSSDSSDRKFMELDPNADLGLYLGWSTPDEAPASGEARVWVSRSMSDETPVDPADHPEARLAGAVYVPTGDTEQVPGTSLTFDRTLWDSGHLWRLDDVVPSDGTAQQLGALTAKTPALAVVSVTSSRDTDPISTTLLVDGTPQGPVTNVQLRADTGGRNAAVLPRGASTVQVRMATSGRGPVGSQYLGLYRLAD
ncbi:hypothetical protein [Nocardioides jishulii]|uniref:Uncharacterized protein n=1 Tax=Nocardioides jishulii TaxID=2575440 RepID=A0A4U2YRA7_9ACTN|nr:hypothetical protein [Nocardioides jishulii]QCX26249.1 hypothetical protein FCL41_00860 [Nocardioides jishulii]TKI63947.1 hypothetical protein FC770_01845 [Nocardioides jishulii]